ncbi:MAG: ATP synthase F1 subunit gamma [Prolixibacteraceae bacterium]|jgi:F-type H+-transporting ATPase subunit gamma|nr:ATP synthase F1 subunit gamma [Prolixibacteraceae bacterium]MDD4754706.1 ATP synthase F1 subunit gamma [Prolixibacteraceae bacterium]NLO03195.1 ATP synthase F1 subunit gamma [Bacteroidales bacterium]
MSGLKEIRTRIASVKTTRQVTSAMKMVSASKLKKAQDAILKIRPYADKMHQIIKTLSTDINENMDSVFTCPREPEKVLIVLISSNRGLCGGFNHNIAKFAAERVLLKYNMQYQLGDVKFICIGKMGERQVKLRSMDVVRSCNDLLDNIDCDNAYALANEILADFSNGKYDRVELIYNQFKNAAVQLNMTEQFLPVKIDDEEESGTYFDFIYEPSRKYIAEEIIPRSLRMQFYKALLDSNAAEQGARMTAMHQATDNATELLKELMLQYNIERQTTITNEILEIVSGAEALNNV